MEAWRIIKTRHQKGAFSGDGAYLYGGRWNSIGTRVIYASSTLSLAALEILVHLPGGASMTFSAFQITIKDEFIETLEPEDLPDDWRNEPPGSGSMTIGDQWANEARAPVLAVPSAIIPHEKNLILNPAHPEFSKVKISAPQPFAFDPRLIK